MTTSSIMTNVAPACTLGTKALLEVRAMGSEVAIENLIDLCKRLNFEVRFDHVEASMASRGGSCTLRGSTTVVLDRNASAGEQAAVLAEALAPYSLDASALDRDSQLLLGMMRRRWRRLLRQHGRGYSCPPLASSSEGLVMAPIAACRRGLQKR